MQNSQKELIQDLIKIGGLKTVKDLDNLVKEIYRETLENLLEAELDEKLGYSRYDYRHKQTANSRNGKRSKTVRSSVGSIKLEVPRDRKGEFEPIVVPKGSRDISNLEDKVLGMYARGMSTRDIVAQLQEVYGTELSADSISRITDKIVPLIDSWQNRPLESLYVMMWLDGLVIKIRSEKGSENHCAHVVLGLTVEGQKDVLGIWIGETESARFWLSVLTDLKNRGVQDILFCTTDGLSGFHSAIEAVFPKTEVQRCLVHQVRACCRFVSYKERKEFCQDMKAIYTAPNEERGLEQLAQFGQKWEKRYGYAVKSWYDNWEVLSKQFHYTPEIRRLMYTTNPIESLNRQFRKAIKTRSQFPTPQAAMKVLYLAVMKASERWTIRVADWSLILGQLSIKFEERINQYL